MARGYPDYRYFSFPVSVAEGGTGVGTLTLNGVLLGNATSQILATVAGAADQVLRVPAAGGAPAFGAVDLAKAAAVTGLLPVAKGGTATATPALVAGANITITGTWPNNTIALTSPITGTFTVGDGAGDEISAIDGGAGATRVFYFKSAGLRRWALSTDSVAEGGADAGSNFRVSRYNDAGGGGLDALFVRRSDGQVGIGNVAPGKQLDVTGDVRASVQLISTVAIGTAPLAVTSTTLVTNLNAERVAGTQVTNAATLGLLLIGSGAGTAAWGTPDGARVYNSAGETTTNESALSLTFDSERYDNGGLHSTISNTDRLTAQKAGKYLIWGNITWMANATGYRRVRIFLNVGTEIATDVRWGNALLSLSQQITTVYHLAAADYVRLLADQSSGGNLDISAAPNVSPEFAMQWLGP